MSSCTNANAWGIIKTDALAQCDIETLRRIALRKIDQLSDEDCADIMSTLKERGVLWAKTTRFTLIGWLKTALS